jgi:vacuolar protein sorting-associated protein 45
MDLVRQVHEFFADYYAVTPSLFTCNVFDNVGMYEGKESWRARQRLSWSYTVDYLVSVLLSQRKNPIIRYQKKSAPCSLLAGELNSIVRSERELFNFGSAGNDSLLLILDRRDDPITPLLQNWTYHALVHENFQIKNNRVNMKSVPNIQKDLNEIVLSVHQDKFFREAMFLNYGELGSKVKQLAIEYQEKTKSTVKIDTIEDMKRFMDKYPEFKEFASNATKHIAIVSEIFRRTNSNALLKVSEVAQNLACTEDHSDATKSVTDLLNNPKVSFEHKLRVVMLYALRYETERNNKIALFKQTLRGLAGNDSESNRIRAVDEVLRISGDKSRGLTLYDNKGLMSAIADSFAAVAEVVGLKGMENVYTKHKPLFVQIVEQALKGRLDNAAFPAAGQQGNGKLDSVYVFVVGGATFAETYGMHSLSQANPNVKIFLGGSCIHNGKTYLDDLLGQGEGSKKDYNLEPLSIDISEQKDRSGTYSSPPGGDW